jgi:predicted neuraminidase
MAHLFTITATGLLNGFMTFWLIFGTMHGVAQVTTHEIPPVLKAGDAGFVSAELIYSMDAKPTPQCHASTMVELSEGVMAAWFGGTHEKNADVGIWTAHLRNGKWTHAVQVVNGFVNDTLRYPCWNPVLFKPAKGPLMLFYKVGPNPGEWWGMLTTSQDEGRTWSTPVKLGTDPAVGDLLGPVKNKPIQLKDGTIICPSSTEVEVPGGGSSQEMIDKWRVHFEVTPDLGKTWKVIGPINDGIEFNAIQPSILTYPDGRYQILCRTQEGVVGESWSNDKGVTWSKMRGSQLPNPNAGTDAVTLKDGRQLIVYNHTQRKGEFPSGRNMLNVAMSRDGVNWKVVATLERSQGEYSYPAVIHTKDGMVHISYTYMRRSIKHVVLDAAKL